MDESDLAALGHWTPEQPKTDERVWRYMSFSSYLALVRTSELAFSDPSTFEDRLEGGYSRADVEHSYRHLLDDLDNAANILEAIDTLSAIDMGNLYVSCWHLGDHESEAMWYRYGHGSVETVAVQSSYGALCRSLEHSHRVGLVTYDADTVPAPDWPMQRLFRKRPAYAHEREVRAVVMGPMPYLRRRRSSHHYVRVHLQALIEGVYTHPAAGDSPAATQTPPPMATSKSPTLA